MLKGLLTSRGFTNISNAYLGQYIYQTFFQQMEQLENEQLNQDAEAYAEEQDAWQQGIPSTQPMEEIIIRAPKKGTDTAVGRYFYPGQTTLLTQQQLMRIQDYFREHVTVTAKRLHTGAITREIEYDWDFIKNITPRPWTHIVPNREAPPKIDQRPVGDPRKDYRPIEDPFPGVHPDYIRNISGRLDLRLSNTGLRLSMRSNVNPRRSVRERTKRRRDRKYRGSAKIYRRILRLVNTTYGTVDELYDVYTSLAWNMTIDGKLLVHYENPVQALLYAWRTGRWDVDWPEFIADFLYMQWQDQMFGMLGQLSGSAQAGLGLGPGTLSSTKLWRYMREQETGTGWYAPESPTGP